MPLRGGYELPKCPCGTLSMSMSSCASGPKLARSRVFFRTLRIVVCARRWLRLANAPCIHRYPQERFSSAMRTTKQLFPDECNGGPEFGARCLPTLGNQFSVPPHQSFRCGDRHRVLETQSNPELNSSRLVS